MALSKLTFNIGLAAIPVRIENLHGDGSKPKGNYVCSESHLPLKSVSRMPSMKRCDGDHDGACVQTVGYNRGDDTFLVPDTDALMGEKDGQVEFVTFVPADEIDPAYFEKTYVVKPNGSEQSNKVFWLTVARLKKLNRVAVGKAVLDKDEKMVFLRYSKAFDALLFCVGCFHEQLKLDKIAEANANRVTKFSATETALMDQIMTEVVVGPFDPEEVKPERWHAIQEMIAAERVPVATKDASASVGETPNILDKLQATIDQAKTKKGAKAKTTAKTK